MNARKLFGAGLGVGSQVIGNAAFFIVLARLWQPDRFGHFVFLYSLASLSILPIDFGYPQRILRDVGKNPQLALLRLSDGLGFKIVTTGIIGFLGIAYTKLAQEDVAALLIMAALIVNSFGDYFGSYLRGYGHFITDAQNLLGANLILVLPLLCGHVRYGIEWTFGEVCGGLIFAKALYFLLSVLYVRRLAGPISLLPRFGALSREFREGLAYCADIVVARSYGSLDTVLLRASAGDLAVGLYQSGQRLLQGFLPFAQVINNVFLPYLSATGVSHLRPRIATLFMLSIASGMCCLSCFIFAGAWGVQYIFGAPYADINKYLWIFGVIGFLRFVVSALAMTLTALGLQVIRFRINTASLLTMIAFALFLSPLYGIWGLLAAVVLANVVPLISYSIFIIRRVNF